jgi:aconitase A
VTQRVLLENLLCFEDGDTVTAEDIRALANWVDNPYSERGVTLNAIRVLLPNSSGVPMLANIRIRNHLYALSDECYPRHFSSGEVMAFYDAAQRYASEKTPLVSSVRTLIE